MRPRELLRRRADRGASAIIVAISLLLLMGMAAVAVDLAAAWNERTQDQTSSDLAAVSGGISFGSTQTNESVVTNTLETVRANLDAQFSGSSDPAWIAAWRECKDADHFANTYDEPTAWNLIGTPNPGNELECISSSANRLRVRVPFQDTDATFGKVLGVDALSTDAYTVVIFGQGGTGLLPFAIVGDAGGGEICLDTTSSPDPPCDKSDRGSFGALLPPQWGGPPANLPQSCSANGNSDANLASAVANGVDHLILKYLPSHWASEFNDPTVSYSNNQVLNSSVNVDLCSTSAGDVAEPTDLSHEPDVLPINGIVLDTGNSSRDEIARGLISTSTFNGEPSRLLKTGGLDRIDLYDKHTVLNVDNTPLWRYINTSVSFDDSQAPVSCDPSVISAGVDAVEKNDLMAACLQAYDSGSYSAIIFLDTITSSPRFAVAPQVWTYNLGSGFSYAPVREFRPVYIAGIDLLKKGGNVFWYPDDSDPGPVCLDKDGNRITNLSKCVSVQVDQITSFLLPHGSFSDEVGSAYPGFDADDLIPAIFE